MLAVADGEEMAYKGELRRGGRRSIGSIDVPFVLAEVGASCRGTKDEVVRFCR